MTTAENKRLASEFFACFSAGNVAGALETMSDDATWWILGKPEQFPAAGSYNKQKVAGLFVRMGEQLVSGLKMTVKSVVAEGDKVAVEVESHGELRNGRSYNNQYHFSMTLRDGKISEIKEYMDTQHAFATWFEDL